MQLVDDERRPGPDRVTTRIATPPRTYRTGLWLALAAILMLVASLTSALVVRKGLSDDWRPFALPSALYYSTVLLTAASVWIERVRRRFRASPADIHLRAQLGPLLILGAGFVACLVLAWLELRGRGILVGTNPSSSFFYLLTAVYAVLLAGGLVGTGSVMSRARPLAAGHRDSAAVDLLAIYWHFMMGLWIWLLVLLHTNM